MRPLRTGKQGEKGGGGHPRCFQVTGPDSGKKSRNNTPPCVFGRGGQMVPDARTQSWKSAPALSSTSFIR